jgi:hypothetical protein
VIIEKSVSLGLTGAEETKTRNWTLRRQVNQAQGQSDQCRQPGRENEGFVSPK